MRTTRASYALALLLALNVGAPLQAFADNELGLAAAPVRQQQRDTSAKSEGTPVATTSRQLPTEVEVDLREHLGELQAQIDELRKQMAEMKELQARDKAAYDARIRQLEQQQAGMMGRVDQIQRQQQQQQNGGWNNGGYGNNGPFQNGPWNNGNNGGYGNNGPVYGPNGQVYGPNTQNMSFWEKLALRVAQGLGDSLLRYMDRKMGTINTNAQNASNELGNRYPQYQDEINRRIWETTNGGYNNGMPPYATPPFNPNAPGPWTNNGGYNNGPVYGPNGQVYYPNNGGNNGPVYGNNGGQGNQTVIVRQSETVVTQNGNSTVIQTRETTTVTRPQPLPRVPNGNGGFSITINFPLGGD
ncbi:MAG: hypothetical protein ACAI25_19630 [Planctomycetota bacterium]